MCTLVWAWTLLYVNTHISELLTSSSVKPIPTRITNTVVTQQNSPLDSHITISGASFSIIYYYRWRFKAGSVGRALTRSTNKMIFSLITTIGMHGVGPCSGNQAEDHFVCWQLWALTQVLVDINRSYMYWWHLVLLLPFLYVNEEWGVTLYDAWPHLSTIPKYVHRCTREPWTTSCDTHDVLDPTSVTVLICIDNLTGRNIE